VSHDSGIAKERLRSPERVKVCATDSHLQDFAEDLIVFRNRLGSVLKGELAGFGHNQCFHR